MSIHFSEREADIIRSAIEWIDNHFTKPFTSYQLSLDFYISEYKLKQGFRKFTGKTISKYKLDKQLDYAVDLLLQDKFHVKEIMYKSGFREQTTFHRHFKEKYKTSPTEWKKKVLQTAKTN